MIVTIASFGLLVGLARSQLPHHQPSHSAAIISDARYLAGDGAFGAAYKQEDGVEFKEESDVYGNRRGSYSYVDPTGQRRTVTYTAGKNGFQATGDHIPSAPPPTPVQPEYAPLPQYNPPDYQQPPEHLYKFIPAPTEPPPPPPQPPAPARPSRPLFHYEYNPEYRTAGPPPRPQPPAPPAKPLSYQYETQEYHGDPHHPAPAPQPAPQPILAHYRIPSHHYQQPQYELRDYEPAAPTAHYQTDFQPIYRPEPFLRPTPRPAPPPRYNHVAAPTPRRFHPPGKLDFNRTPDGFSYTFSKS